MIKVIVGYKVKNVWEIQPILHKLRTLALQYQGFIGFESLQGEKEKNMIVEITTWDNVYSWNLWESSALRQDLLREASDLLDEDLKVAIYRMVPTTL
jgi:antibiotic biosynthesis monooxygenase (ABM) superfamily enzyme